MPKRTVMCLVMYTFNDKGCNQHSITLENRDPKPFNQICGKYIDKECDWAGRVYCIY